MFLTEDRWQQQQQKGLEVMEARVADVALLRSSAQPHSKSAWQGTTALRCSAKQHSHIFTLTWRHLSLSCAVPACSQPQPQPHCEAAGEDSAPVPLPLPRWSIFNWSRILLIHHMIGSSSWFHWPLWHHKGDDCQNCISWEDEKTNKLDDFCGVHCTQRATSRKRSQGDFAQYGSITKQFYLKDFSRPNIDITHSDTTTVIMNQQTTYTLCGWWLILDHRTSCRCLDKDSW